MRPTSGCAASRRSASGGTSRVASGSSATSLVRELAADERMREIDAHVLDAAEELEFFLDRDRRRDV
jgi:hypothetical protein